VSVAVTGVLGVLFLGLAVAATLLMFQFWGYPYDEVNKKSSCPQWKMNIHRGVGYAYFIVYIILMSQMVPRMWTYQVEFPARTVAHIILGITIGVILVVKISILRWFRHFEEMMPTLGLLLLLCTFLLVGLSVPFVLKERVLASTGDGVFADANRQRVATLLVAAGVTDTEAGAGDITTVRGLQKGREVLLSKCTYCHDLRTAISRPRTPKDWFRTVTRMAEKPSLGPQLSPAEVVSTTAYLVAITPDLQNSAAKKRQEEKDRKAAMVAAKSVATAPPPAADAPPKTFDATKAKELYDEVCSQCHGLEDVDDAPPTSAKETDELIERMVENGLEESKEDLTLIRGHMLKTFVEK